MTKYSFKGILQILLPESFILIENVSLADNFYFCKGISCRSTAPGEIILERIVNSFYKSKFIHLSQATCMCLEPLNDKFKSLFIPCCKDVVWSVQILAVQDMYQVFW